MIRRFQALNYRCLRHVDLELDRFHVLAGTAGSGKSTLFDALEFVGDLVREGPAAAVAKRTDDFRDLVRGRPDEDQGFELAIEFDVPDACRELLPADRDFRVYRYELAIRRGRQGPGIHWERGLLAPRSAPAPTQETLFPDLPDPPATILAATRPGARTVLSKPPGGNDWFYRETDPARGWVTRINYGPYRSTLGSLPDAPDTMPVANSLKLFLETRVRRVSLRGSALAQPGTPGAPDEDLAEDGHNLARVIKRLQEDSPAAFDQWLGRVRSVAPGLKSVEVAERAEDRHACLWLRYESGLDVPSWMESGGTLRLLAVALLPALGKQGRAYLIDEPEAGVNPSILPAVRDALASVRGSQVLAATCSDVLLNLFEPGSVLRFRKNAAGAIGVEKGRELPAPGQ